MDEIMAVNDLVVGYKKYNVLGPVNFKIKRQQLLSVIGTNGSGKSTLMKTIAGIIPRISGCVFLDGSDISAYSLKDLSMKRSILTSNFEGYVNYKLREILAISRYPFTNWLGKISRSDIEIINRALELTGLSSLDNRMIYELSDGEKQKLSIARAYCQDTPLIFLDEPFVHLDLKQKILIAELISDLVHNENKTVIIATHDLSFVKEHGDSIIAIYPDRNLKLMNSEDLNEEEIEQIFELA